MQISSHVSFSTGVDSKCNDWLNSGLFVRSSDGSFSIGDESSSFDFLLLSVVFSSFFSLSSSKTAKSFW